MDVTAKPLHSCLELSVSWPSIPFRNAISYDLQQNNSTAYRPGQHNSYAIPKKILAANIVDLFIAILTVFLKF